MEICNKIRWKGKYQANPRVVSRARRSNPERRRAQFVMMEKSSVDSAIDLIGFNYNDKFDNKPTAETFQIR